LWRDQVADKPLLLVLDDAASTEQVRPLLPGVGGSLVLVTSRRHLVALEDATAISLDSLPPAEAAVLLVRLAGRAGLSPTDPEVQEIIRLCGCLPLAVGMVARQLRHHPVWSLAGRARELAAVRDRLALMETENLSVAAAFDLSYVNLTGNEQRLFRRLGLHPGDDTDSRAAAALDGTDLAVARRSLGGLYDQYLVTEPVHGRFRLHDLLRAHSRALAGRFDLEEDRDAATARLLEFYQITAAAANSRVRKRTRPGQAADSEMLSRAGIEQALTWTRIERANLLACIDHAAGVGQRARVVALTAGISGLLQHDGPYADAVVRHAAAIQAAQDLGDWLGQANALIDLATVRLSTGDYPLAEPVAEEALGIYRDHSERLGEADALNTLGNIHYLKCDYQAAAQAYEEAHSIYRDLGDRLGVADTLNGLGIVSRMTGDYPAAVQAQEEVLRIYRDLDDQLGQANALNFLGNALQMSGNYQAAAQALEEALASYRNLDNRLGMANALNFLGTLRRMTADYSAAAHATDEALAIYRDINDLGGAAMVLNERGTLHRLTGELTLAQACHRQSQELSRQIDSSWDEAHALAGLGRCALAVGDAAQAAALLREALEIFQRIGAAETPELLAELGAIADRRLAQ
jgi:tetratricopeptide (TPR) repeat protein